MKLTPPERLVLWNLFEIRKQLDASESDYWARMTEIVSNGYQVLYSDLPQLDEEMPEHRGRFVFDVLDLYRRLHHYIEQNPDDADVAGHGWANFKGFDGNNETDLVGFCRFVVHKQGKWAEQVPNAAKTDDFNSHMPTQARYTSMIRVWRERGTPHPLSAEDARAILDPKPPSPPRRGDEDRPRRGDKFRV